MHLKINIDGASMGNPGKSGIGIVIYKDNEILKEISQHIGYATNNKAEYMAAIKALEEAEKLNATSVSLITDSELLANQLKGVYKVRSEALSKYHHVVTNFIKKFENFNIHWTPRKNNKLADGLAEVAINPDKIEIKMVRAKKEYVCKKCKKKIESGKISKIKTIHYAKQKYPKNLRFHSDCVE